MSAATDDRHLDYVHYTPPSSAKTTADMLTNMGSIIGNNFMQTLQDISTSAAEANRLSAAAAYAATQASMAEGQRNRDFQEQIYNRTSAYNAAEAAKNREWQERMSNTAYQRAVADMRAAGLNPILAVHQGGASTPSGSSTSIGTLSGAMGSAYSYQAQQHQNDQIEILGAVVTTGLALIGELINAFTPGKTLKETAAEKIYKGLTAKYNRTGSSSAK